MKKKNRLNDIDILNKNAPISEEDEQDVMREIDAFIQKNDITTHSDQLIPQTDKTGLAMPITVASILLFVAIAIVFIAQYMLGTRRESAIVNDSNSFQSIESQLINELVTRAEQELDIKEKEIQSIQNQLDEIATILLNLDTGIEHNVSIKKQELLDALDIRIEAERSRLTNLGINTKEIEASIIRFTEEHLKTIDQETQAYRIQLTDEIRQEQVALQTRVEQLQTSLETKHFEQRKLKLDIANRKEELDNIRLENASISDLTAQLAQVSQDMSEYEARYQQLLEDQENVELVTDQIQDQYSIVFASIGNGDYQKTTQSLDNLGAILNNMDPANPLLTARVSMDKEIVNILRSFTTAKQEEEERVQRLLDNSKVLSDTLNESDESISQTTLQKKQLQSAQQQIEELQISLQRRNAIINALKRENEEKQNSLALSRALLTNQALPSQNVNALANAKNIYRDGLIQVQNLLNRGNAASITRARTVFINAIEETGLLEGYADTMEKLDASFLQSQPTPVVPKADGRADFIEEPANEIMLGYISKVLGSSEIVVVSLNAGAVRIGANVAIYRLQATKRTRIATGVIFRIEGTGLTAQIRDTLSENKIQLQDVVYLQF